MRYDLNTPLRDHRGHEIKETGENGNTAVTLGDMLERACLAFSDPNSGADAKYTQYKLAKKLGAALEGPSDFPCNVDLTSEEVTLLKALAAKGFAPIVYGTIVDLLETPLAVAPHELDA